MKVLRRRLQSRHNAEAVASEKGVAAEDELFVPHRKRLTHEWSEANGERHLCLFYGARAVRFDEPGELAFAEHLLKSDTFRAGDTTRWSAAEPYRWDAVKSLLDTLLAEGILRRVGDPLPEPPPFPHDAGAAAPRPARTWSMAEAGACPALAAELTGIPFEIGHLEVVVPVHRVAHPALDTDGRQVGEFEVTPRFLYLDLPAERRTCSYSGSRYQDEHPLNLTALKLMMTHWPHVLALCAELRDRITARTGRSGPRWQVGDLHLFAIAALAAPAYLMVRGEAPVPNRELPAAVATLFRVVCGVRIATLTLLLDPDLATTLDTELSADDVFDYSEKLALFLGRYGVCAGPPARIREFLDVVMNDAPPPACDGPSLDALLGDVDAALDYSAAATQIECIVQTFLGRQYAIATRLFALVKNGEGAVSALAPALERLLAVPAPLRTSRAADFHASLFQRTGRAWKPRSRAFEGALDAVLPRRRHDDARVAELARLFVGLPSDAVALVDAYFAEERAALALVREQVHVLNDLLRRPQPTRALVGEQLQGHARLAGGDLGAALGDAFGVTLVRDAESTTLQCGAREIVVRG